MVYGPADHLLAAQEHLRQQEMETVVLLSELRHVQVCIVLMLRIALCRNRRAVCSRKCCRASCAHSAV